MNPGSAQKIPILADGDQTKSGSVLNQGQGTRIRALGSRCLSGIVGVPRTSPGPFAVILIRQRTVCR